MRIPGAAWGQTEHAVHDQVDKQDGWQGMALGPFATLSLFHQDVVEGVAKALVEAARMPAFAVLDGPTALRLFAQNMLVTMDKAS